jgi:hypothetical protein
MNTLDVFNKFSDDSRVWLYQTDRALNENEISLIQSKLSVFVKEWAAHGNKLWANADVINPYFIAIAVDDSLTPPSGCSIDASVKELQGLGKVLNIDFFTRMKVTYEYEGDVTQIPFADLSNLENSTLIYDTLISNLGDLRKNFPVKLEKSSFAHLV